MEPNQVKFEVIEEVKDGVNSGSGDAIYSSEETDNIEFKEVFEKELPKAGQAKIKFEVIEEIKDGVKKIHGYGEIIYGPEDSLDDAVAIWGGLKSESVFYGGHEIGYWTHGKKNGKVYSEFIPYKGYKAQANTENG